MAHKKGKSISSNPKSYEGFTTKSSSNDGTRQPNKARNPSFDDEMVNGVVRGESTVVETRTRQTFQHRSA